MDAFFWMFFSLLILLMSVFPNAVIKIALWLDVQSPANFVFLVMVFLLFIWCFFLTIRLAKLESNQRLLVEELAIRKNLESRSETDDALISKESREQ